MLALCLWGLGLISWYRTPVEFMMRIDAPFLGVNISYPTAGPQQVEQEVTIPAEGEFKTISDLKEIYTYSGDGNASVNLMFDWGTDMQLASSEVRERIERLRLKLPAGVENFRLFRYNSDDEPVYRLALFRDGDTEELANLARTRLRAWLQRIDGVADVEVSGSTEHRLEISFDQNTLRSMQLSAAEVAATIRSSAITMGLGQVIGGGSRYFVRVEDDFRSTRQIEDIVITPSGLRVKDVATLELAEPPGMGFFTFDGKKGVFVSVQKESEANTVEVCDLVRDAMAGIKRDPDFADIEMQTFHDQSTFINASINDLYKAGNSGALLAFVVLLLFLQRMGPTLIVGLITPTALVSAMAYLYFTDRTVNVISMTAMLISLGMLVDNSIVVVENIHRYREMGLSRMESARRGAGEVAMAITSSTLTTVVVFMPLMYMQAGQMSIFMGEFAGVVIVSLLASLILALTIVPLAESRLHYAFAENEQGPRLLAPVRAALRFFHRAIAFIAQPLVLLQHLHRRLLALALRHRLATLGLTAAVLAATYYYPMQRVTSAGFSRMGDEDVDIQVRADQNLGEERITEIADSITAILEERKEEFGIKHIFKNVWERGAWIEAMLVEPNSSMNQADGPYSAEELERILNEILPDQVPGARLSVGSGASNTGAGGNNTLSIRMLGEHSERLDELADRFMEQLRASKLLTNVQSSREDNTEEIRVDVDKTMAANAGASPGTVAQAVNFALSGTPMPYLKQGGREIPVWAQNAGEDRRSEADLNNVAFGEQGALTPISQIVNLNRAPGTRGASRINGKTVTTINGLTTTGDFNTIEQEINRVVQEFQMPRGYTVSMGEEFQQWQEDQTAFRDGIIFAVLLIYIVMAALFESLLLPLSIITTVPLAFVGVFWCLFLTDTPLDTIALVGAILMCGIVVNNGIVIVDHINQLRLEGMPRTEAIVQAGFNRFRPVLMTSLTTILGILPIAIGETEGPAQLSSIGRSFAGGLTAGTLLTLVVVPVIYTLIDDLQVWIVRFFSNIAVFARSGANYESR